MTESGQQSRPRRPSLGGSKFLPIKVLTSNLSRWRIQARVVEKSQLNTFQRKGGDKDGAVFNCVITDADGGSINCKFWNEAATLYSSKLEKGKVYVFSRGRIGLANKKYTGSVDHPYELIFDSVDSADIEESTDTTAEAIPTNRTVVYSSLRSVSLSTKKLPFVTNILGVVHSYLPKRETTSAQGEQRGRRAVNIVDATGYMLQCTLWGDHADVEESLLDAHPVIAIANVQIRDWRGRAGSTLSTSEVVWNPKADKDAQALKEWYHTNGDTTSFEAMSGLAGEGPTVTPPVDVTVKELHEMITDPPVEVKNDNLKVTAYITSIGYRNPRKENAISLFYNACGKCNRKMNEDSTCPQCLESTTPIPRMSYGITLADHTAGGNVTVRVFSDQGASLLGVSASKLHEMTNEDTKSLINICELVSPWKRYRFTVRPRLDMFQGKRRLGLGVVACIPATGANTGVTALQSILKILPEALDSHSAKRHLSNDTTENMQLKKQKKVDISS